MRVSTSRGVSTKTWSGEIPVPRLSVNYGFDSIVARGGTVTENQIENVLIIGSGLAGDTLRS